MAILLTGPRGFLGGELAKLLIANGYYVIGLSRNKYELFNNKFNEIDKFKYYNSNKEVIRSIFIENEIDLIIHTATSYGIGFNGLSEAIESNIIYPLCLMETALQYGKPGFINVDTFFNKRGAICEYLYPYSYSKYNFDKLIRKSSTENNFKYVNVRLEHMYGFGENPNKFVSRIVSACNSNMPELNLTKGEQVRDFINIADVVAAFKIIVERMILGKKVDSEYSLGSGIGISLRNFVEEVKDMTKSKTQIKYGAIPYFSGEPMYSEADITSLQAIGWQPTVNLRAGIYSYIKNKGC
jgi:CDP-paratose synthetase